MPHKTLDVWVSPEERKWVGFSENPQFTAVVGTKVHFLANTYVGEANAKTLLCLEVKRITPEGELDRRERHDFYLGTLASKLSFPEDLEKIRRAAAEEVYTRNNRIPGSKLKEKLRRYVFPQDATSHPDPTMHS